MRHVVRTFALTAVLAGLPCALGGCRAMKTTYANVFYSGEILTYERYLSVDTVDAPTADEVIEILGKPASVTDRNGVIRRVDYWCFSFTDELKRAEFHFDADGRLDKKELW